MVLPNPTPANLDQIQETHLYLPGEVARIIGAHRSTVHGWIQRGIIKSIRVGSWNRVPGSEVKRILMANERTSANLEYSGRNYPTMAYYQFLLVTTANDAFEINRQLVNYRLVMPDRNDLDALWAAILNSAPPWIRRKLEAKMAVHWGMKGFDAWVAQLGIAPLFEQIVLPCRDILEDSSEKRIALEVLLCGRVPYKEIIEIMKGKYAFEVTEEALDFYARFFFNTYSLNSEDVQAYLGKLTNATEAQAKRRAWGNPDAAKLALEVSPEVDFEAGLNLIAATAMLGYKEWALRGPQGAAIAKEQSHIVFGALDRLMKLRKAQAEEKAASGGEGNADAGETFVQPHEEPVDVNELEQPTDIVTPEDEGTGTQVL